MKVALDTSIFRDYDIRGIYPDQINDKVFFILGASIASYLKAKTIAVGFDARLSSKILSDALIAGITGQGVDVVNLGLISSEISYFASGYYKFPVNIIVSASHNPPQYNGLKIVTKNAVPLHGGFGLPEIKKLAMDQEFLQAAKKGKVSRQDISDDWIRHCLKFVNSERLKPLKVVIDAGNGMGGISWAKLADKLPVKIIPLYFEPDGRFPNHLPDPSNSRNLADLKKAISKNQADLGLATDGDADRLFVLDEKGNILSGTVTTSILARHLLSKSGPAAVLYNAVCGKIVPETISKYGGEPIRVRVGHSFIKEYMKKHQALLAGEHSGHFYFRDNYYADSSTIAGLLLLEYISGANEPMSRIASEFQKYKSSGEINFRIKNPKAVVDDVSRNFADAPKRDFIDGLSVWFPDWWFNLRASNTEPVLRLNAEAQNESILKRNTDQVKQTIKKLGGIET